MSGAVGLSIILFAGALMTALFGERKIAGYDPNDVASMTAYAAMALLLTGWAIDQFRGRWTVALQSLLVWAMMLVGLSGAYSYRTELQEVANRIVGDIGASEPVVGTGGEVSITRRLNGSFLVAGKVNDRPLRFVFDTGASTVVITAESAKALGLDTAGLRYRVPVSTANGMTMAALVTLDRLSVGSITAPKVRALVAQPGVLYENLLGMTFLERLTSYEVRGNRLILRASSG